MTLGSRLDSLGVREIMNTTIDIVKSTVPILKKHDQKITTRIYKIMFQDYQEVKAQFDMSVQANSTQPAKLANAQTALGS